MDATGYLLDSLDAMARDVGTRFRNGEHIGVDHVVNWLAGFTTGMRYALKAEAEEARLSGKGEHDA